MERKKSSKTGESAFPNTSFAKQKRWKKKQMTKKICASSRSREKMNFAALDVCEL